MMECDYLYGWSKKTITHANILPKVANPIDVAGHAEEEEENFS